MNFSNPVIDPIGDFCGTSGYAQDSRIARMAGATLTRAQYNQYSHKTALRWIFGTDKDITDSYFGKEADFKLAQGQLCFDVIKTLGEFGVTFDLADRNNGRLKSALIDFTVACGSTQGYAPAIPEPYASNPHLRTCLDQYPKYTGVTLLGPGSSDLAIQ